MMVAERNPQDNPVKSMFETRDMKYVAQAIDQVRNSDIIPQCYKIANEYRARALQNLNQLPKSSALEALYALADFVTTQGT